MGVCRSSTGVMEENGEVVESVKQRFFPPTVFVLIVNGTKGVS